MVPGEYFLEAEGVEINSGMIASELAVFNSGDRPIQVGSHFHFFETNAALIFEREGTHNKRLDIPSGTAVRFEPGQTKVVMLIDFSSTRNNGWSRSDRRTDK